MFRAEHAMTTQQSQVFFDPNVLHVLRTVAQTPEIHALLREREALRREQAQPSTSLVNALLDYMAANTDEVTPC